MATTGHWLRWALILALATLSKACLAAPSGFNHAYEQVERHALPQVELLTAGHKTVKPTAFTGRWVWLYFGYTNCPDICPTSLSFLADAHKRLGDPGRVQVVFVSVDPARDTPDRLAEHAAYFDPSFIGATGSRSAIDALTNAVGARYELGTAARPGGSYTVNHSNVIYVLDPRGRLVARYAPGEDPGALAADFNALDAPLAAR